jgi:hypothetical protein
MRKLIVIALFVAACSKHNDRKEMCRVALKTLEDGLQTQIKSQKDPELKSRFEAVLKRAQERFTPYCESASEEDIDCLSQGTPALSDPKCKHAVDGMKTMFAID